ncbi:hypothetical protein AOLI_G00306220 [Acnodon oligacanthus]
MGKKRSALASGGSGFASECTGGRGQGTETDRRQSFTAPSYALEKMGLRSSPARHGVEDGGRKFAFCAWSWWAFFCLHVHVSTAVSQGERCVWIISSMAGCTVHRSPPPDEK